MSDQDQVLDAEVIDESLTELSFDADVGKVLELVTNSLYTNKDICVRELVSNSSDALERLRHEQQTNHSLGDDSEKKITIRLDDDAKYIEISDNGIGMSYEDLKNNLGTIANSGTKNFFEKLKEVGTKGAELIGQFGVGFYSSFMIAKEVAVQTRKAGDNQCWEWRSSGKGNFTIKQLPDESMPNGTVIKLYVKDDQERFLDRHVVEGIVTMYCDHISFPIDLVAKSEAKETIEPERINESSALWAKSPSEVSAEEYNNFYKSVAHVGGEPWMVMHNRNEGAVEFTNLLYIPGIKPFDLFNPERRASVRLYCNKVFITEDNVKLIPNYMRFLRGLVDSPDVPLNISRETLQDDIKIQKISTSVVSRVMRELLEKKNKDMGEYKKFWGNFGPVLKEGLCEIMDTPTREKLIDLCLFSSNMKEEGEFIDLKGYVDNMKEGQDTIYYLIGDQNSPAKYSPQLGGFKNRGIEVILCDDHVDTFWTSVVNDYKGKKLKSITSTGIDLEKFPLLDQEEDKEDESKDSKKHSEEEIENFIKHCGKILESKVEGVYVSKKLTDNPVCLSAREGGMDIKMQQFLKDQNQLANLSLKILEVNVEHEMVSLIIDRFLQNSEDDLVKDYINILFDQACVVEKEPLHNPAEFLSLMNKFLVKNI